MAFGTLNVEFLGDINREEEEMMEEGRRRKIDIDKDKRRRNPPTLTHNIINK